MFGMREFLAAHDTEGWDFINFDGVGADAPLRVLSKEGGPLSTLKADPELMEAAAAVGAGVPGAGGEATGERIGLAIRRNAGDGRRGKGDNDRQPGRADPELPLAD